MPIEVPPNDSLGLVVYEGSIEEYRGKVFHAESDPDFPGRYRLDDRAGNVLNNVRHGSFKLHIQWAIENGLLDDDEPYLDGIQILAQCFKDLAVVIAADWSAPPVKVGVVESLQNIVEPWEIEDWFVQNTLGDDGFIHPEWSATPFTFGHWGF